MAIWSDDPAVVALARKLWDEGLSASKIGARCGTTKGAIIGCAHRNLWPARPSPIRFNSGGPSNWSVERDTIIKRHWPMGLHVDLIRNAVNRTPGPSVSNKQVGRRAMELDVRRPATFTTDGRPATTRRSIKAVKNQKPVLAPKVVRITRAVPAGHPLQCRAPTGESPRIRFECLNEQAPGRSYCSAHCRIFHVRRDEAIAA